MYRMVLKHDVGAQAPGFTLKDPDGRDVSLESFREKENVLLVFSSAASTGTPCVTCGRSRSNIPGSGTPMPK